MVNCEQFETENESAHHIKNAIEIIHTFEVCFSLPMRVRSAHDFRPNWRGTSTYLFPSLRLSPKRKCLRIIIVIVVLTLLTMGLDIFLSGGSALKSLLQIWTGFNLPGKSVNAGEVFFLT